MSRYISITLDSKATVLSHCPDFKLKSAHRLIRCTSRK